MRKQLCDALLSRSSNENMIFLTGDLGFMALEPLQQSMGNRFINAGLAEQNMISVAAALAAQGFEVWVYSIASFLFARPFEQIRNDVAFHHLPVNFIGNGGGYGYGVMGPTHHAIGDYGALLTLPNFEVFVPVFDEDVNVAVSRAAASKNATYVRLGRTETVPGYPVPPYDRLRQLTRGDGGTLIAVGPLAGLYASAFAGLPITERPNIWAAAEICLTPDAIPKTLLEQILQGPGLCIAEEHVRHGSFASDFMLRLSSLGVYPKLFHHSCALAHHYDRYGSQTYLRKKSQLDPEAVLAVLNSFKEKAVQLR